MYTALVSAGSSTSSSFSVAKLLVLIVLLAIGIPLMGKLRRSASQRRKRRWAEEGLMDVPPVAPDASDSSD